MGKRNLTEIARVIRSKNSGPFELTLDIMFTRVEEYTIIKTENLINASVIARLYKIPEREVMDIIYFDPAYAVKVVLKRKIVSGSPGDTDVYGAQQHAPLLELDLDL